MPKKKIILSIALIAIVLIVAGLFYFPKKQPEKIDKLSLILENAKGITGMNLNLAPDRIKWNADGKELTLSGKGCFYVDALNAPKVSEIFDNLGNFFGTSGFRNDSSNSDVSTDNSLLKKYKKDEIVCNLIKKANSNNTSTVSVACADIKNVTYNFNTGEGNNCNADSDCGVILDACERKRVCRNLKYEFFNDCENPSARVDDVDFSVAKCQCVSNQCVPKKPGTSSPAASPKP